jgi:hypothetical protein
MRNVMMKFTNWLRTRLKILKNKRFRPFCLCPPDVMFVTRGSKNSLFVVFDSLSNFGCGQWCKLWIYQSHPMCWLAGKSISFARSFLCPFIFCWMVGHFLLRIATRRRDSQGGKPHCTLFLSSCYENLCVLQLGISLATLVTTWFTLADCRWRSRYRSSDQCILSAFRSPERYNGWFREQLGQRFTLFQFISNDDRQCLKFSLKRDGKWEQGEPVCWYFFLCTPGGHFC